MSEPDPTRTGELAPPAEPTFTGADPVATNTGDHCNVVGGGTPTNQDAPRVPAGRYELGTEIARGGMGVVYRATDTTFAREVAVKVLQEKFGEGSSSARRFADEARITGQLQHPAIPPVHDFGILPDGRQFLAMKLIKGETLHELLKARTDPSAQRGRFVAAFEQVCQAVAYAHAHQVIHRDLKPANVMVGSYGEVQVMDWGLAEVLTTRQTERPGSTADHETLAASEIRSFRDSDSEFTQAGAILGTPAFMPPEQAIGAIAKIDTRSDVFGLGAILTVILTGRPPFVGNSIETTRLQAAQGNIDECYSRLDASGAEPELVALCKRCLSRNPADRPANGGEVARAVAALRTAADERARQAELETVRVEGERQKAELQVAEQRKRRRVQFALAGICCLGVAGLVAGGFWYQSQLQETRQRAKAEGRAAELVKSLASSDTAFVPRIIDELAAYRTQAEPALVAMLANAKPSSKEHLHASLALLSVDPGQVEDLFERLLSGDPQEVLVIRDALASHKEQLTGRLWPLLEPVDNDSSRRLRAACALAAFAPDDPRWEKVQGDVAAVLVTQKPFVIARWANALKPVGNRLLPVLAGFLVDENRTLQDRSLIASVYGIFAADTPDGYARLEQELAATNGPEAPDDARIALARKQASLAVALLVMGHGEKAWPLLKHSPDPTRRSYLIERLAPGGIDPNILIARLKVENELSVRRAILLSLGEYGLDRVTPAERRYHVPGLLSLYRDDPDPGIHGASDWLLRRWGATEDLAAIDRVLATGKISGRRRWYLTTQFQTMTVVSTPGEFWIGEGETRHRRKIDRNYAIAAKEVTVDQFLRFRKEQPYNKWFAYTGECPAITILWYDAAAYCNWLSEQDGIPKDQWCYLPNKDGQYAEGMSLATDHLNRTGYRLPTEAEWEYACRLDTQSEYSFGSSTELLGKYVWYDGSSLGKSHPVGMLKPNDLGLFDMHGNAWEWCQEAFRPHPKTVDNVLILDTSRHDVLGPNTGRVLRGGSYNNPPTQTRSANRNDFAPTIADDAVGFRPTRTILP